MKRILSLLILVTTIVATNAETYFPGGWFASKQPGGRQGGGFEAFFYDNNDMEFDIYHGGLFLETVSAKYYDVGKSWVFFFHDSDGWFWDGRLSKATLEVTGKFSTIDGQIKGKFQVRKDDDGR
jgi:hypothetical protein